MLCRAIAVQGLQKINSLLIGAEMAEIRLEKSGLSLDEIKNLFGSHPNLLATCRTEGLTDEQRTGILTTAINAGAKWVDIEVESDDMYSQNLVTQAKLKGCRVIISYHNYENTPSMDELEKIINDCHRKGADLIKISTMARNQEDNISLLSLYQKYNNILSLGMGKSGSITRIAALKLGAPFTFVSCDNAAETAPGQITESNMKLILSYL